MNSTVKKTTETAYGSYLEQGDRIAIKSVDHNTQSLVWFDAITFPDPYNYKKCAVWRTLWREKQAALTQERRALRADNRLQKTLPAVQRAYRDDLNKTQRREHMLRLKLFQARYELAKRSEEEAA